jgi:hypothetical protein
MYSFALSTSHSTLHLWNYSIVNCIVFTFTYICTLLYESMLFYTLINFRVLFFQHLDITNHNAAKSLAICLVWQHIWGVRLLDVDLLCDIVHVCSSSVSSLPKWLERCRPQSTVYLCIALLYYQQLIFCFLHFSYCGLCLHWTHCGMCSVSYIVPLIHKFDDHFYWPSRSFP